MIDHKIAETLCTYKYNTIVFCIYIFLVHGKNTLKLELYLAYSLSLMKCPYS